MPRNLLTAFAKPEEITPERLNALVQEINDALLGGSRDTAAVARASSVTIEVSSASAGDHGVLLGLADDDHTQYLKEKASGGIAAEVPTHTHADAANAGTIDHGALTGLSDDDHAHYHNDTRGDARYPTLVSPSTDSNFVAFNGVAGAQKDSGYSAASFVAASAAWPTDVAIYTEMQVSGTAAGSAAAATFNTRTLNVDHYTKGANITRVSNDFTLQPGIYHVRASAPASMVGHHQLVVYNNTTGLIQLVGSSEWCAAINTRAFVEGVITVTSTAKSFCIKHYTANAVATTGLGSPVTSGAGEIYTIVSIFKI